LVNFSFIEKKAISITQFADELLFPQFCNPCDEKLSIDEIIICKNCKKDFNEIISINRITELKSSHSLDFAYSGFWFDENLQNCMHGLKYQGFTKVVQYLLDPILALILKLISSHSIDYLVPVPLHSVKLRERGFNQAMVICNFISNEIDIPILNCISRDLWTESQTTLSINERQSNINNVFSLNKTIHNSNILIIDDVLTTGSTANECAKVIKKKSNSNVGVFTIGAAE